MQSFSVHNAELELKLLTQCTEKILRRIQANGLPRQRKLVDLVENVIRQIARENEVDPLFIRGIQMTMNGLRRILLQPGFVSILQRTPLFNTSTPEGRMEIGLLRSRHIDIVRFILYRSPGDRAAVKIQSIRSIEPLLRGVANELGKEPGDIILLDPMISKFDVIPYSRIEIDAGMQKPASDSLSKPINLLSVVVLDVEGQYPNKFEKLDLILRKSLCDDQLPRLDYAQIPENTTLSSEELDAREHLKNFMPDLTQKSLENLNIALTNIEARTGRIKIKSLREDLEYEIEKNQTVHQSIKKSLSNSIQAFYTKYKDIFDLPDCSPLTAKRLLSPGIHVLDVSELSEDHQRNVAIYLMSILDSHKIKPKDPMRVVVLFDEAHKLFPRKPNPQQKDYFTRIYESIRDVTHRGRKRNFGVIISTQVPSDVAEDLLNLPDTKILFEENSKWTKQQIGRRRPPTKAGQCLAILNGTQVGAPILLNTFNVSDGLLSRSSTGSTERGKPGTPIGYLTTVKALPAKWKSNQAEPRLPAYGPSENVGLIKPGRLLKSESSNGETLVTYWEIVDITRAYEDRQFFTDFGTDKIRERRTEEYRTYFVVRPVKQGVRADGSLKARPFNPDNYTNTRLVIPSDEEFQEAYDLPGEGFLMGLTDLSGSPLYLPYHPSSYEPGESEWQIDHSMVVIGNQGRGKTNLLVYLTYQLGAAQPFDVSEALYRHFSPGSQEG